MKTIRSRSLPKLTRRAAGARVLVIVCLAAMSLASGCQSGMGVLSTPITGRKQILLVSEAQENELGVAAYQEVLKEEPLSRDARLQGMVQRVGQRIAAVANRPDFDWEFNLIDSPTQNAFCLPGGKVAIYRGILDVCESEAGLAVVMSHEIGHAIARHGGERMTHSKIKTVGWTAADSLLLKDREAKTKEMVQTAYGFASDHFAILPYSRKHELEADHIGLMLMSKAGYDPREAPRFWERFGAATASESAPAEFFSTHPSSDKRAAALAALTTEAMTLYEQAPQQFGRGEDLATPAPR